MDIRFPVSVHYEYEGEYSWTIQDNNLDTLCYVRDEWMAKQLADLINKGGRV